MLLSEPLASLITFFSTSLIKFYLNIQRMSFYNITESSDLKKKGGGGPKHTHSAMFWNFAWDDVMMLTYAYCDL